MLIYTLKRTDNIFRLELVEHIGSGMGKILTAYNKENFIFMEHFLRFSIPFNKGFSEQKQESSEKSREKKQNSSEKIIELIKNNPAISAVEISKQLNISSRAVEKNIDKLNKENKLKRIGADKGGYWEIL